MRLNELTPAVTRPTDRGLVIDVRGLRVTAWSINADKKILFRLDGGTGRTTAGPGRRGVWLDVSPMSLPLPVAGAVTKLLQRWLGPPQRTLRLVMAPGKGGLLIEDANHVLPLPNDIRPR